METYIPAIRERLLSRDEACFAGIANDPVKLRYWIEIERIWRASLDAVVRRKQGQGMPSSDAPGIAVRKALGSG